MLGNWTASGISAPRDSGIVESSLMSAPQSSSPPPTAAAILIGNELLSGKIRDENGFELAKMARRRGIEMLEIVTVADDEIAIGQALHRLLERTDIIFTSGGVGPTHDDLTLASVAKAFGRKLVREPQMESILRAFYREKADEAVLKMADLPEGTSLSCQPGWPVLRLNVDRPGGTGRVYILPGIPGLFRKKLIALEHEPHELPKSSSWDYAEIRTHHDEAALAQQLASIALEYSDVEIGSYPIVDTQHEAVRVWVKLTFESRSPGRARAAQAAMLTHLPTESLVEEAAT